MSMAKYWKTLADPSLPKKPDINKCKFHQIISHITKIIIWILMNRTHSRIRTEIGQNRVLSLKTLEQEMQYLCSEGYQSEQYKWRSIYISVLQITKLFDMI